MKIKAALAVLALTSGLAVAKTQPKAAEPAAPQQNAVPVTFVGCEEGTPSQYFLIDNSGRTYNLTGQESLLAQGVHAQVEVNGSLTFAGENTGEAPVGKPFENHASETSTAAGVNNSGDGTSANGNPVINVTQARQVAATCDNFNY